MDCEKCKTLEIELIQEQEKYDRKCDELRELIMIASELRLTLAKKGVDHEN